MTRRLILDLDTGIDDALAIAYALASPEVELIGITGTYGNVLLEQGLRNDLAITDLFGHPELAVYAGLAHASMRKHFEVQPASAFIHGGNGIGEAQIPDSTRTLSGKSAVDFIIESADAYGRDLIVVPTGPLTNLAQAIHDAPRIIDEIGRVVLMGGALTVRGNVSPWAEANISQDPDAADAVFRSGIRATMVGLDVTLRTLLTFRQTARWRALGTRAGTFLADAVDYYIKAYETTAPKLGGCGLHDPLAVAVAVDPTLVTTLPLNMTVDTQGPTRGRTIGDNDRLADPHPSMEAATKVDAGRFLDEFMARITALAGQER